MVKTHDFLSGALLFFGLTVAFGATAHAVPMTDVVQSPTAYFAGSADPDTWFSEPYYRGNGQNWGWTHNPISATTITSAALNISAFDVDNYEIDGIYAYDGSTKVFLGNLVGLDAIWKYTTFDLPSTFYDDIQNGLKIEIAIDANGEGFKVSLSKSVLSLNGAALPTPEPVPLPPSLLFLAPGLLATVSLGRRYRK